MRGTTPPHPSRRALTRPPQDEAAMRFGCTMTPHTGCTPLPLVGRVGPSLPLARIPQHTLTMSNSPTQRGTARRGGSSPRVGVQRGGEPRRRGQLDELRVDIRLRGRDVGAYDCAVVAHEKLDRLPERAVRPADGQSVAIAQRGEIGGLDRRALRLPLPHRLDDLLQPCPTLRRDARAALIDLAAAALPAPAGFVVARAP